MPNQRITIKGTSNGLIITIGAGVWPTIVKDLDADLSQKASFFKGGRVALQVGPRQLTRPQLETVGQLLNRHHVTLWAVESEAPGTQEAATQLGLETDLSPSRRTLGSPQSAKPEADSLMIRRTLRSGQVIHHPGHIVIIGDVNPGAEIKAGGNVIVWGRLRGNVYAGAKDNYAESAVVCALQFAPMQLRIGNQVTRSPANDDTYEFVPEMASLQNGQIVAEAWSNG